MTNEEYLKYLTSINGDYGWIDTYFGKLFGAFDNGGFHKLSRGKLRNIHEEIEQVLILNDAGFLKYKIQEDPVYLTRVQGHLKRLWYSIQDLQARYYRDMEWIRVYPAVSLNSSELLNHRLKILGEVFGAFLLIEQLIYREELSEGEKMELIELVCKRVNKDLHVGYKNKAIETFLKRNS